VARIWRSGFWAVVTEIEQPLAVRRLVSLAEAIYSAEITIEDLRGIRADGPEEAMQVLTDGAVPVIVDPAAESRGFLNPAALVDARMKKTSPELDISAASLTVGLGPGIEAGVHVHAVVETNRGHRMGRVFWEGSAQPDTGIPDPGIGHDLDRVLRAPASGVFAPAAELGTLIETGTQIATVGGVELRAPFDGALRGLLHGGIEVEAGIKVGDLDPRQDLSLCTLISDKSLAAGGGVLEALLSKPSIRKQLAASFE
jgi:xanthine dehydrogenase accessory factor